MKPRMESAEAPSVNRRRTTASLEQTTQQGESGRRAGAGEQRSERPIGGSSRAAPPPHAQRSPPESQQPRRALVAFPPPPPPPPLCARTFAHAAQRPRLCLRVHFAVLLSLSHPSRASSPALIRDADAAASGWRAGRGALLILS